MQLLGADGALLDHGGGGRYAAVGGAVVADATVDGPIGDGIAGIDGRGLRWSVVSTTAMS